MDNPSGPPDIPQLPAAFEAKGHVREQTCPVCLGQLSEMLVTCGDCLHLLHDECARAWLRADAFAACPVCRVPYATRATIDS